MMDDSIFLKALNKEKLSTPPIWYMRQAGRYMPEYRAVRKNFKNLKNWVYIGSLKKSTDLLINFQKLMKMMEKKYGM